RVGQVRLELDRGAAGGKLVAELEGVRKAFGDKVVVDGFSATLLRGDKIGIVGPNGAGKTTLLKMLLGQLAPDAGRVRLGTGLQVAYFDQLRTTLEEDATLADTISPGGDWIEIGSSRQHVASYLGKFLFPPQRAQSPVRTLSGGERNRLLLARLFARPANLLVLDEPTNDLDIETLELLEELLAQYDGTVFLVSHDRRFLDNVVTSLIVSEGERSPGMWREYEGGIEDWLLQRGRGAPPAVPPPSVASPPPLPAADSVAAPAGAARRRRLSFKEQRELDELPGRIEALEAEQRAIGERLGSADLYQNEPQQVAALKDRFDAIETELMAALERWEAISAAP
ncbi:MAG: ATP-binding cassette domain-containing protein, partial [Aquabacterium sp.]